MMRQGSHRTEDRFEVPSSDGALVSCVPALTKFAWVSWWSGSDGGPVLDSACAWISCTFWPEYDGGDHTIVAGRVRDLGADATRSGRLGEWCCQHPPTW